MLKGLKESLGVDLKGDRLKKRLFFSLIFTFILFIVMYFILSYNYFISNQFLLLKEFMEKGMLVFMIIFIIFIFNISIKKFFISKIKDSTFRFYSLKLSNFFTWIIGFAICVSLFLSNWTAVLTSLGVMSIVLGIALQSPVSNFFAWIVLLISPIYKVGDRIKIGEATGDVIDIGYFYTTLWEFGGDYVSADLPSGRIIVLPNSEVFSQEVYNYSWTLFPYIWSEIFFYIAYDSDFDFVEKNIKEIAVGIIGEKMKENVAQYRKVLASTPVDDLEVQDEPRVSFIADSTTWIKVTVRFIVEPKSISQVKKELFLQIMSELSKFPQRVRFPNGDAR